MFKSGISAFARTARPSFAAATRRAVRPTSLNLRASALSRFASTSSVGDGKIYQVIGTIVELSLPPRPKGPSLASSGKIAFRSSWLTAQLCQQQVPSSMVSSPHTRPRRCITNTNGSLRAPRFAYVVDWVADAAVG
ncbi:hypothetical protein VTJ49DRAFT_4650 [Mycothermus thermophilus]|uniref:Uncharacterized protein n=1 Tax=Humicola insolens TaxID=85995 RepID=A0ABR3V4U1_HUMIN